MKTLQIDEKKALSLYSSASEEFKAMLEDSFGLKFFKKDIRDRVKSYEDACRELKLDPASLPDVSDCPDEDKEAMIAYYMLSIIARALNEGWKPDWLNSSEYKHYPWFDYDRSASGFVFSHTNCAGTGTDFGSRLCFKTRDLAEYAGKQFCELYNKYFKA
jgi:hypothetical protein